MKVGSYEHKKRFCRILTDSPIPHDLPFSWPALDREAIARLQSIPFWADSLQAKRKGGQSLAAFAQSFDDLLLKNAFAQLGQEQFHQAAVLESLMREYGIPVPPALPSGLQVPSDNAVIDWGYRHCLDTFFGCGLFALVRERQFLPEDLWHPADDLLNASARHALFFVNWLGYRNVKLKKYGSELRGLGVLFQRRQALLALLTAFGPKEDEDPTPMTELLERCTAHQFLQHCRDAHQQRFQALDADLLQPHLSPNLAQILQDMLKLWPQRRAEATIDSVQP
ncbi:MAG: hypothetical protein WCD18_03380 [Thermosynechococcaceae cyanobacterium]